MPIAHRYTRPDQFYLSSSEDYGCPPYNSTPDDLPPRPWGGQWPQYVNGLWILVEDHRERKPPAFSAEDAQEGIAYWLPDDTHHTPARHMPTPGPLPRNVLAEQPAAPEPTSQELTVRLRDMRDSRLAATDKYLLADYPIGPEELADIKAHRQVLRDLPQQPGAPWDGGGDATPWPALPQF
ncbi:MAG: tail fiber assembly protein [Desulfovibrio sp.]|nr:tail fiber assembly protein [Desulfovibrio sp.]